MLSSQETIGIMNIKRTAEQMVKSLECPPGAGLHEIHARVALHHRKEIILQAVSNAELRHMTGLWVETDAVSHVVYRADDSPVYQAHSIFHEFGHIIADHETCGVLDFIDHDNIGTVSLGGQIQRARARGFNHDEAEVLAEEIAYELSRLVIAGTATGLRAVFE